jgi:hypothetical protein
VTLQKYFSHPSFSYILFCNPTHKTRTGTANTWGTTNSKPLGSIIMMDPSYLLHSFLQVHIIAAAPFTSHHKLGNYAEPKTIFLSQPCIFSLFFIQFYSAGSHTELLWGSLKTFSAKDC